MSRYVFILALLFFISCADAPNSEQAQENQEPETTLASLDLTSLEDHHIAGKIALPDISKRGVVPSISFNDITGMLDIEIGRGFHIQLREESLDLNLFKSEWELDPVWQHNIVSEAEDHILYSKQLPDGSMQQFHFVALLKDIDRSMVIRSAAMEEFDQENVELMLEAARSFRWNTALAQS